MNTRTNPWRGVLAITGALAVVAIIVLGAIVALRGQQAVAPTATPVATTSSVPTTSLAPTTTLTPAATPTPTNAPVATGSITGLLSYPSDFIPAQKIFAVSTADSSRWYRVDTPLNPTGATYTLSNVPAGSYKVYAYTSNSTPTNFAGGSYTEYVRCGMQPPCSDHTVIVVTVTGGQTTQSVDLRDWYAPQGAYPPPPA
jgi:hypothetical protein